METTLADRMRGALEEIEWSVRRLRELLELEDRLKGIEDGRRVEGDPPHSPANPLSLALR